MTKSLPSHTKRWIALSRDYSDRPLSPLSGTGNASTRRLAFASRIVRETPERWRCDNDMVINNGNGCGCNNVVCLFLALSSYIISQRCKLYFILQWVNASVYERYVYTYMNAYKRIWFCVFAHLPLILPMYMEWYSAWSEYQGTAIYCLFALWHHCYL